MVEHLRELCRQLPDVRVRQSRMASPETQALCLLDEFAHGPEEAFIDGHEFCHMHPMPEGSLHLTLPSSVRKPLIELGWAESHVLARAGFLPDTLVMVYAPRNDAELQVVFSLVAFSWYFAEGLLIT